MSSSEGWFQVGLVAALAFLTTIGGLAFYWGDLGISALAFLAAAILLLPMGEDHGSR
jgi:hypothetical protein